ncbi:MAG: MBL fold metallo-hydrolase [Cyanobacteria bacterium P01_D01_bin.36]
MAHLKDRRTQNVEGDFYVDSTCIDCDTCRWLAPSIYSSEGGKSIVHRQPTSQAERITALEALLACPTGSIGTQEKPTDIQQVQQRFPLPIEGAEEDGVYYCGYHSKQSYGAASYFIRRPEGNVLVDSPRFTPSLVKQIEALGGVHYMYLTHRDDVADHQKFHDRFGCDRILHTQDITPNTHSVEIQPDGNDPVALTDDLLIIPQPGHSAGHTVLLYKGKYLFTGDHLAWSARLHQLYAFRNFCWDSWPRQVESMKALAKHTNGYRFEWVLPGHGRRFSASAEDMPTYMQKCVEWMASDEH